MNDPAAKSWYRRYWYRQWPTNNPWTKAGGAEPVDWPKWMRTFKDY